MSTSQRIVLNFRIEEFTLKTAYLSISFYWENWTLYPYTIFAINLTQPLVIKFTHAMNKWKSHKNVFKNLNNLYLFLDLSSSWTHHRPLIRSPLPSSRFCQVNFQNFFRLNIQTKNSQILVILTLIDSDVQLTFLLNFCLLI